METETTERQPDLFTEGEPMSADVIDSEVVESTELSVVDDARETGVMLGSRVVGDPREVIKFASDVAGELREIIKQRQLFVTIHQKEYVYCEGWTTMGGMLGAIPREVETVESSTKEGEFIATVEVVRVSDNTVISKASASCGPDEKDWRGRSRQARRSMALTRATSKAFRLSFSWIMQLAGYEVVPGEEMDGMMAAPPDRDASAPTSQPRGERVTKGDLLNLVKLYKKTVANQSCSEEEQKHQFREWVHETCGIEESDALNADKWTREQLSAAQEAIDKNTVPF